MMSDMPQRIWAQRSMDGDVWAEPLDSFELYTEYVRADKYADLERQRDELVELLKDVDVSHDINGTDWLYSCRRSEDGWITARDEALAKAEKAE
jgi:hypothetical protein